MRGCMVKTMVLGLLVASACKQKGEETRAPEPTAAVTPSDPTATNTAPQPPPVPADPVATVGVSPGGIAREAAEGPAAIVTAVTGTVEVRRVGETSFAAAPAATPLYPGDVVRTGEASAATLGLADTSVVQVAEVSAVAIGSREGTADPASSAAVLAGVARFSVAARAPGEGAFRVYTPAGVVRTRGTVYGVGVAASGQVRVGVERGAVDVLGLAALDAPPIAVEGGAATTLEATGTVAAPAPWPTPDWGAWRAEVDGEVDVAAAVDAHAQAMAELEKALTESYAELTTAADAVATFEAGAATSAEQEDTASYEASLPDGAATIEASFAVAGHIEALTWANAARATLATELYVRHPDVLGARWEALAPRVDAAVLWPKRFDVTATAYLVPLRAQYYVHHPRGRAHAPLVGITVPAFYAQVSPPALEPERVRARVTKTPIWQVPELAYTPTARPVWIAAPSVGWHAKVKLAPAAFAGKASWYVRPPSAPSKILVGGDVTGRWESRLAIGSPAPRATLHAVWKVPVGAKIQLAAPDLAAAARARGRWKARVEAPAVRGGANVGAKVGAKVGAHVGAAPNVKVEVGAGVRDRREAATATLSGVKAKVGGAVEAGARVRAGVQIKAPTVKVKAPSIQVKGEAKGRIKLGN